MTFIGVALAALTGITVFAFHTAYDNFKERVAIFLNEFKDSRAVIDKTIAIHSSNIWVSNIRSKLYDDLFEGYARATLLKDQEASATTRIIPDIMPIFSIFKDQSLERARIQEAFYVLLYSPVALETITDEAWEYIEKEVAPKFENDRKLHQLILDVIKKRQ